MAAGARRSLALAFGIVVAAGQVVAVGLAVCAAPAVAEPVLASDPPEAPDAPDAPAASDTSEASAKPLPAIQGPTVVGTRRTIEAVAGDSLTAIAAREGLPVARLARDNGLGADARLALGQRLQVETAHVVPIDFAALAPDAILVNVPQRMLFERRGGALVGAFPIAAGRPSWQTPLGEFTIDARKTDKPWIVPRRIQAEMRAKGEPVRTIVPPGPDNPLGRHWLGLSRSSIGLHGTNAPASLYSLRTHGCIRLHPGAVAALFERSRIGDPVTIVYEPVLLATTADERICLEVHPDAYDRAGSALAIVETLAAAADATGRIDWTRVTEVVAAKEGLARDVTRGSDGAICVPED